ncbi:hypothetical protein SAMN04488698_102176 [Candidatus Frackibacter sp. WG12]|nr:hypothetical protein SAMN04515661_10235 [Candidatus Frackibacter sp. WG11]SEM38437.1 hypothetical protein SAMN04488698_102176 [Candidatus Frackibacter sp. WG12]SFL44081.1 hypothetical protein SAMN04488699_102176 [Candidatus Frackibacter sp. WG13]
MNRRYLALIGRIEEELSELEINEFIQFMEQEDKEEN